MIVRNVIRFFGLILLQVLVLNHIFLGGYINPYLYVLFILLLPFESPKWLLLVSGFLLGIGVDIFTDTPGLNAAACVLMAFGRPFVIQGISRGTGVEYSGEPSLSQQGFKWFFYYSAILVLLHHLTLFYLEIFRLGEFFQTLARVLLSSAFTLGLVFIVEYIRTPRKK
jgi:hypothetical protein